MKALGNLPIGTQGRSSHPNALRYQADRSQAEENSEYTCNLADLHLSSFGLAPLFSSSTSQYTSYTPSLYEFSCVSIQVHWSHTYREPTMLSLWARTRTTLEMIKWEHSIFALPFALTAVLLAADGRPAWGRLGWI